MKAEIESFPPYLVVLDLQGVSFVDLDVVRFLAACEEQQIRVVKELASILA